MPIYEYLCTSCALTVEKMQSFSEPHAKTCEDCGGRLQRLYSSPGVVLRGSGWHSKDYK